MIIMIMITITITMMDFYTVALTSVSHYFKVYNPYILREQPLVSRNMLPVVSIPHFHQAGICVVEFQNSRSLGQ